MSKYIKISNDIYDSVFKDILNRHNILLHCCGGSGKSVIAKRLKKELLALGIPCSITSTTGVSAFNLGSMTIHRFSGLQIADKEVSYYIKMLRRYRKEHIHVLEKLEVLIIDEISMCGKEFFDKLNMLLKTIRRSTKPFGGVRLVLSGDFLQLPPVKDDWVFNSVIWEELEMQCYTFHLPMRYMKLDVQGAEQSNVNTEYIVDTKYYNMLLRIRRGEQKQKDIRKLLQRCESYKTIDSNESGVVRLYSYNSDVMTYNNNKLCEIDDASHNFKYTIKCMHNGINTRVTDVHKKYIKRSGGVQDIVTLKVGAQVILIRNIDVEIGLVNGSTGVIKTIQPTNVLVEFTHGVTHLIEIMEWEIEYEKDKTLVVEQIPLKLGWAFSIHKSQSLSFDKVIVDLSNCFSDGQAYVALSRCRSLDGLYITDFNEKSLKVNKEALEFENSL
jgi:ATP-dependent DNA helicase PIF1